jgi:cytochrome c biogenesis protein CcdA
MALTFRCPECNGICAFAEKHAGRGARCTRCQSHFIIPASSDETAKKITLETNDDGGAISGFYRAVFVKSWKVFIDRKNLVGLALMIVAVLVKFVVANSNTVISVVMPSTGKTAELPLPFGHIIAGMCWGVLLWYYMQMINSTAFEVDEMPEPVVGGFVKFITKTATSLYVFAMTLGFVELPCIGAILINEVTPIDITPVVLTLAGVGFFLFPMAFMSVSVNSDLTDMFHVKRMIPPIAKVFRPYLTVASLVFIAGVAEYFTSNYNAEMLQNGPNIIVLNLAGKIFAQIPTIIAVRSMGLLYRHYGGFLL